MPDQDEQVAERRALDAFTKLMRASHTVAGSLARSLAVENNLTRTQLGVLEALLHLGPLTPGELARKVFRSEANLTTVLDNLERDGLIVRVPRPEDRRSRTIQLTGEGRALTESVFPDHAARIRRVMGALSADEQTQLAALCRKLGVAAAG